jgi:hypothetical protein
MTMCPHHQFVDFVEANKDKITENMAWCSRENRVQYACCATPHATDNVFNWRCLDTVHWLPSIPDTINWEWLSICPAPQALDMLEANRNLIDWWMFCQNTSRRTLPLIRANPVYVNWSALSGNSAPHAIQMLRENPANIRWRELSGNSSSEAVALLKANPDKICWRTLSRNEAPEAIAMLAANPSKIDWWMMSGNKGIWKLDCAVMRKQMAPMREELLRNRMHPSRLHQATHHWLIV